MGFINQLRTGGPHIVGIVVIYRDYHGDMIGIYRDTMRISRDLYGFIGI